MSRLSFLGLLVGLAGCGSTVGAFDGLPKGSDVSDVPWPRLVDTPEAPTDRLIASNGVQASERLDARRGAAEGRLARAQSVPPVSDSLLARGATNQSRPIDAVSPVDEVALLARASQLQTRTAASPTAVDDTDLLARAARSQTRTAGAALAVDDSDLLARAARLEARTRLASSSVDDEELSARAALLRQRSSELGAVNEADLSARATRSQFITRLTPPSTLAQAGSVVTRAPTPLRPLDTPVVSSSFEERARLARERAAGL